MPSAESKPPSARKRRDHEEPLEALTEEEIEGCPYRNCNAGHLDDPIWCAERKKWLMERGRWKAFYAKRHELHTRYKAARRFAYRRDANNDALEWVLRLKPGDSQVVVITGDVQVGRPRWFRDQAEKAKRQEREVLNSPQAEKEIQEVANEAEHEVKAPLLEDLPTKTADDMDWVACHADDERIPYETAPSRAAVQVLRWVRSDAKAKDTFFTHYMKTAQKKADESGEEEKDEGHERALRAIEDLRGMSDEALEEAAAFREESTDGRAG